MPHTISWTDNGLVIEFCDTVTAEEFVGTKITATKDPRYNKISYYLVDLLHVTDFLVDSAAVRTIAELDTEASEQNPDVRAAIVAKRNIMIGFARMYELYGAGNNWDIEIFDNKKVACEWLGIEI